MGAVNTLCVISNVSESNTPAHAHAHAPRLTHEKLNQTLLEDDLRWAADVKVKAALVISEN